MNLVLEAFLHKFCRNMTAVVVKKKDSSSVKNPRLRFRYKDLL
jgi:hypothetical protein